MTLFGCLGQHVVLGERPGGGIALLDQQPVGRIVRQALQHPAAGQLLAGEAELDLAGRERRLRIGQRHPGSAVPDDHRARAVVAVRNAALEGRVVERVILDQLGEAPHLGIEARPLRHRPALQRIADLQAQVVVHAPGVVLLDDEDRRRPRPRAPPLRLRRLGEAPLGPVGVDAMRACARRSAADVRGG